MKTKAVAAKQAQKPSNYLCDLNKAKVTAVSPKSNAEKKNSPNFESTDVATRRKFIRYFFFLVRSLLFWTFKCLANNRSEERATKRRQKTKREKEIIKKILKRTENQKKKTRTKYRLVDAKMKIVKSIAAAINHKIMCKCVYT